MARLPPDSVSQKIALISVFFGISALVLACVGLATPKWQTDYYTLSDGSYMKISSANFFYTCVFYTNGSLQNCTNRGASLYGYSSYNPSNPWETDFYQRMQNAGALCIVGIALLFLGIVATLIMAIEYFSEWGTYIPPILLFLASLFMLAGMAEGSRYLFYNDYSANLFQTGHLLTIFTLLLATFAAGRIHFSRWTAAGRSSVGT